MKMKAIFLSSCFIFSMHASEKFLIFGGKNGWIGQKIVHLIQEQGHIAIIAKSRLENRQNIENEINETEPNFIINAAGVIGRPNVDWCEDHTQETIRCNIIGALNLADVAYLHGIHVTNIGTGCIYYYDNEHPMYGEKGFTEEDEPNFSDAMYCKTKIMLEKMFMYYPNVLYLRTRLPIASDVHPRNLVTKLTKYQKVVNIPNSLTVLNDLLPVAIQMTLKKLTGIYNFVNPGTISHNEILDLYKKYVDPNFSYVNFTLEEQNKILKVRRCHNELDVTKLLKEFPNISHVKVAVEQALQSMVITK